MDLTCPKCHGAMRTYERNGVHVDQCADCRGIFLDRGELDRLIDAENAWHAAPAAEAAPRQAPPAGGGLGAVVSEVLQQTQGSRRGHDDRRYGDGYGDRGHKPYGSPYKKRKSFLGELFD